MDISHMQDGIHAGLGMLDKYMSGLEVVQAGAHRKLQFVRVKPVLPGPERGLVRRLPDEVVAAPDPLIGDSLLLRVRVMGDSVKYSYSVNEERSFHELGPEAPITFTYWRGSRPALFSYRLSDSGDPGFVDFDWARYQSLPAAGPRATR